MQNEDGGAQVLIELGWGNDGEPGVCLIFPQSTFIETPGRDPRPGVVMSTALARTVAWALLLNAQYLENGAMPVPLPRPAALGQ